MKYLHLTAISFKTVLAYRAQFFAGLASSLVWLAVMWFVWTAVFSSSPTSTIGGLTLPAIIAYATVSIAIRGLLESDNKARIESMVRTGAIVTTLIRPIYYPVWVLFQELGPAALSLILRAIPVILIAMFVLGIAPPANFPAFIVSVALFLAYQLVARVPYRHVGLLDHRQRMGDKACQKDDRRVVFRSGNTDILLPAWLAGIAYLLPFQAMFNIPLSIYTGLASGPAVLSALSLQLAWVLVLGLACWFVWRRAEKKMVVQGG